MSGQLVTMRQVKFVAALAEQVGVDAEAWSQELFKREVDHLDRAQAYTLIEALYRLQREQQDRTER